MHFLKVKICLQFLSAIHRPFQSLTPAIEKHLAISAVRTEIFLFVPLPCIYMRIVINACLIYRWFDNKLCR